MAHGIDIIDRYFPALDNDKREQFRLMQDLYNEWNSRINVISRKDMDLFYERHVLHSMSIAKIINFEPGTSILDVGTGGGFPGIPLAIMFPECNFHLVDSIGKKIKVVQEVTAALTLENVVATHTRAEKVKGKYDFVVSRAVTRMKPFLQWVVNKIKTDSFNNLDNGILYLKGGDLDEEMNEVKRTYQIIDLKTHFSEEFFETKKVVYLPL